MKYSNSLTLVKSLFTRRHARRGLGGLAVAAALLTGSTAFAAATSSGSGPWTASADITNNTSAHTGIVVSAATYYKCVNEFNAAMADHQAAHGDTFGNIKYCGYLPTYGLAGAVELVSVVVLNGAYEELSDAMADLEAQYQLDGYLAERAKILEQYRAQTTEDTKQEPSSRR